jgi:SAGA-associated factor 73
MTMPSRHSQRILIRTPGAKAKDGASETTPQINRIPGSLGRAFPNGKLMEDKPNVLKCNHCKRPVLKHAMPAHIERCLNKKQEKQRKKKEAKDARDAAARKEKGQADDEDDEDADGAKKTASKTGGLTASKKRKAVEEAEEGATGPSKKKKKKDEAKSKAPKAKAKAPVDVEKQCGVELPQGGQCARSLTCKSHSMGAKRAVPGRSAPYDKLLMEYQRKNQAKLQKAAFDANAPDPDDDRLDNGPVDSEEEKDAVMAAIAQNWGGAPLYQAPLVPLKKRYDYNRMRGMLSSALGGRSSGSVFGNAGAGGSGFFGPAAAPAAPTGPTVDENGVVHPARRGSVVPGARSMMAPASRKPSVAAASAIAT